jgi:dipeptidyl aminopeptidase/acylaminoacyl peptidase
MKRLFLFSLLSVFALCGRAQTVKTDVNTFLLDGPFAVVKPYLADTVNAGGTAYKETSLLDAVSVNQNVGQRRWTGHVLPSLPASYSVGMLTFYLKGEGYAKVKLAVKGVKTYRLLLDGEEVKGELPLTPYRHVVNIKYLAAPAAHDTLHVTVESAKTLTASVETKHDYDLHDCMDGRRVNWVRLSPDGKMMILYYTDIAKGGTARKYVQVRRVADGGVITEKPFDMRARWMNRSDDYLYEEKLNSKNTLYRVNPLTGARTVVAADVPDGDYMVSPTDDYVIYTVAEDGVKETSDVFEVLEPDDQQEGWRNRTYLMRVDLKNGVRQRLTYGTHSANTEDISSDGKQLLFSSSHSRLTKRPTTVTDLYRMDMATLKVDTIFRNAEFIQNFWLSPDGKKLLVMGSAEAFGGLGEKILPTQKANMTDMQLFLYDLEGRTAKALTRDFDPSINSCQWSKYDGMAYFTAYDKDYIRLYAMNPLTGKIRSLHAPEDVVTTFSVASASSSVAYIGQSVSNSVRMYVCQTKKGLSTCVDDCSKDILKDVTLGECRDWNFVSSRGDTICGRYYLPPHFDANKRYPLIVNYYGGCVPTERSMESRYPAHAYAAQGYVVYVLQPSGAVGFGQEFSARHVGTWGKYTADDIIEGTKKFCADHPFINAKKVGCIGASYGGFMTMYLQTVTDIFAAAISHAGISNITSYWGGGYWGYSYGEVASADEYPWTSPEMYTRQSPLFNAEKVKTPILFLHGTEDTNVPPKESMQMFIALKLLGRETALVEVRGENHHILDYKKRLVWQDTIFAWFDKWLKDDSSWWNALYPPKHL